MQPLYQRFLASFGSVLLALSLAGPVSATTGAVSTTDNPGFLDSGGYTDQACLNHGPVDCNIYVDKHDVWLSGLPNSAHLNDGTYFFAVLDPGSQHDPNDGSAGNLSSAFDTYANRTFTLAGGIISYSGIHQFDISKNIVQLFPYLDTSNPGGVYILAVCQYSASAAPSVDNPPGVDPSTCKYDAFKIRPSTSCTEDCGSPQTVPPTISKDATGAYKKTYAWTITKAVDQTTITQVGGSATFNYTVTVSHDAGTISDVGVAGTIAVLNGSVDGQGNTVGVDINGVTDSLSDGTVCTVTGGGAQRLGHFENDFDYSCSLSVLPPGQVDNTATVSWPLQTGLAEGSASYTFSGVQFTGTPIDNCVNVTDSIAGTLGTVCVADANPTTFKYSKTVSVPTNDVCTDVDNTATFTTNSNDGGTGSASQSVHVCGAVKGGLTMGFWQNKNGQGIITAGASTSNVCNSGTWLRQYLQFQDLSNTANCAQVATYAYNIIKAANASGASMNAMLKAQDLATSLDVYFSTASLGGNKIGAPTALGGVKVNLTKVCIMIDGSGGTATCSGNYQNVTAAFGGSACMTINDMLGYAAGKSNVGGSTWYANVKAMQGLAKNAFDATNNQVALVCQ
jgi:hypothetical protein